MNPKTWKSSIPGSTGLCLLSQLFNHNDNKQRTAMITDLRKHINGDFDASQLLKQLDMVRKPFLADHWQFSSPAAMLGAAILIAVIEFAVWRKCYAQATHTAHVPMITTPMPQPQPRPAPAPSAPVYVHHQNPTFNFSKPTAPVLIYT
jgi:hypothetical protein